MTTEEKALTSWDEFDGETTSEDLARPELPELKLIQKAVPEIKDSGRHGGDYCRTDTGEFEEAPVGVFIYATRTRVLFDEGGSTPLCASDNGRYPRPSQPVWDMERIALKGVGVKAVPPIGQPSNCATCPFAQWGPNHEPPPCQEGYLTLFEAQDGWLGRLRFKGTSFTEFRDFAGRLAGTNFRRGAKRVGLPLFSKRVRLTSVEAKEGDRLWYESKIEILGEVDPALGPEYQDFAQQIRTMFAAAPLALGAGDEDDAPRRIAAPEPDWGDGKVVSEDGELIDDAWVQVNRAIADRLAEKQDFEAAGLVPFSRATALGMAQGGNFAQVLANAHDLYEMRQAQKKPASPRLVS